MRVLWVKLSTFSVKFCTVPQVYDITNNLFGCLRIVQSTIHVFERKIISIEANYRDDIIMGLHAVPREMLFCKAIYNMLT